MRRVLGVLATVLGVLLLGLGILAKPVLYEGLAIIPLDQDSTSVSEGSNMSALYAHEENGKSVFEPLQGVNIRSTREVLGIPGKPEAAGVADTDAFWQTTVQSSAEIDGAWTDLSYSNAGVSLNRVTAEATNCCGDFESAGDLDDPAKVVDVEHEGLYFKFPFDVQKQTYQWWDGDLDKALDIEYVREEEVYGTNTYVFQQVIPKQEVTTREVPKAVFGDSADGNATATVMYGNTRTLYIEPVTGAVVNGVEEQDKSLVADGYPEVATTQGTIGNNEETVRDNAETWGSKSALLGFIKGPLTWIGIIGGLVLTGLGLWLILGARTDRAREEQQEADLDELIDSRSRRR